MIDAPDINEKQVGILMKLTLQTKELPINSQFDLLCHVVLVGMNMFLANVRKEMMNDDVQRVQEAARQQGR